MTSVLGFVGLSLYFQLFAAILVTKNDLTQAKAVASCQVGPRDCDGFSSLCCSSALVGLDKGHSAGVAWA